MNVKDELDTHEFSSNLSNDEEQKDDVRNIRTRANLRASISRYAYNETGSGTPSQLRRSPRKAAEKSTGELSAEPPRTPTKRKLKSESEVVGDGLGTPIPFKLDLNSPKVGHTISPSPSPKKKSRMGYAPPETYAHLNGLPDRLAVNLDVLFCGINPGKKSAEVGFHYANPTNHFWRCLHLSGFTDRLLQPREEEVLPEKYNVGLTDLVERPSVQEAELSTEEMFDSVPALIAKIKQYRPRIICFVGKGIWLIFEKGIMKLIKEQRLALALEAKPQITKGEALPDRLKTKSAITSPQRASGSSRALKVKAKADLNEGYGLQPYQMVHTVASSSNEGSRNSAIVRETLFFVMPSTSGRVVSHQLIDKTELFKQVRQSARDHREGKIDYSTFQKVP